MRSMSVEKGGEAMIGSAKLILRMMAKGARKNSSSHT
jgi:hypothetical protein